MRTQRLTANKVMWPPQTTRCPALFSATYLDRTDPPAQLTEVPLLQEEPAEHAGLDSLKTRAMLGDSCPF